MICHGSSYDCYFESDTKGSSDPATPSFYRITGNCLSTYPTAFRVRPSPPPPSPVLPAAAALPVTCHQPRILPRIRPPGL